MMLRPFKILAFATLLGAAAPASATSVYWSVFNPEDEVMTNAVFVTYATLDDMIRGQNPITGDTNAPGQRDTRANIVGSGSDGNRFWNVFNYEGDNQRDAIFVLYDSFQEMSTDQNRLGTFRPDGAGRAANAIGSASDGSRYWTLFNDEGDLLDDAVYVLYGSLMDMLLDENPLAEVSPTGTIGPNGDYGANVVGTGSDGQTFWSLFNFEGDAQRPSIFVTYNTLEDLFGDVNRKDAVKVDFPGVANRVGSGFGPATTVPLPAGLPLLLTGVAALGYLGARRRARSLPSV